MSDERDTLENMCPGLEGLQICEWIRKKYHYREGVHPRRMLPCQVDQSTGELLPKQILIRRHPLKNGSMSA